MFQERFGNMWDFYRQYDAICILTNMQVDRHGNNVMGRGSAYEARRRYPFLPLLIGHEIRRARQAKEPVPAGRIWMSFDSDPAVVFVAFMTKDDWREKSDLKLIERAAHELMETIEEEGWSSVLLPRPGCGAGQLDWKSQVKPILIPILDERVTVVAFEERAP